MSKYTQPLSGAGLDTQLCHSQTTIDGAGNVAGCRAGCAALFTKQSPRAIYHYCSSHDLNLVLFKSCEMTEVHALLSTLKQLGMFLKYSPKRSRRLEAAILEVNSNQNQAGHIKKSKLGLFCETKWAEKYVVLNFAVMYEPLLIFLEAIGIVESGWDG